MKTALLLLLAIGREVNCSTCSTIIKHFEGYTCVENQSSESQEEAQIVEKDNKFFLLKTKKVSFIEQDVDLQIRQMFAEKSPACTIGLIDKKFIDGLSIQILDMPGSTFRESLQRSVQNDQTLFGIFSRLAHCIAVLNENGWVHRMLSADNIILERSFYPKLINFDSAVRVQTPALGIGILPYAAPEVLENWKPKNLIWSGAQDSWSFGILLYETLFGFPPFNGNTPEELYADIKNTPMINIKPNTEISFIDVLNKSLKLNEKNRSHLSDFENLLSIAIKFFGKYVERQVSVSLTSFTVLEKASLIEMFSEMIFIVILCFFVIPISVFLITAKVNSEEQQAGLDRNRQLAQGQINVLPPVLQPPVNNLPA